MDYIEFLKKKINIARDTGFEISLKEVNPIMKFHQRDIIVWAIKGGKRGIFASFGLGKTGIDLEICRIILKHEGGKALIVLPLGVKQEFYRDAVELLGMEPPQYIRNMAEVYASTTSILLTNYERVRDGDIDPLYFTVCSLDEAAVLRSYGSDTYQTFLPKFKGVKYKFVFTATPSPNRFKELIHYGAFLEIMDSGQSLTRFFQRDSTKANNLTLYPHKENEFWLWMSSWALFITKPSDLGYSDDGYDLPPLKVRYHEIPVDHSTIGVGKDGQMKFMYENAAVSLPDAMKEKRRSINIRVSKMMEVILNDKRGKTDISESLLREEQRAFIGNSEKPGEGILSGKQGCSEGQIKEMEVCKSRANEGTPKTSYIKKQGNKTPKIEGMVFEQQGKGEGTEPCTKTKEIWVDGIGIQQIDEGTKWPMRNMSIGNGIDEQKDESICGPQPYDRQSQGASLSEMQCCVRNDEGRPKTAHESSGLPDQIVIWCDLNDEQRAIEHALKNEGITFTSLSGDQDIEYREEQLLRWKNKETSVFLSKPEMYGAGVNLQQCHTMIFIGIGYKFEEFFQSIHRIYRFMQKHPVTVHIIYTENEKRILQVLLEKWKQHNYLTEKMTDIIKKHGLSNVSMIEKLKRSMGVERVKVEGKNYTAIYNDCILEMPNIKDNNFDLIHTSIPFGNHYEYTASYNDFGFNEDTEAFLEQMDFLSPHLYRTLKPGRVFACHVKDRVLFGNTTGTGMPTIEPFHALCIAHYMKHGFQYFGMITVVTDVVRENNQTYRLGWTECCKDGSKMGIGCPEYILLFRKLPTDTSNAYADIPVSKSKEEYTRAQWQIDAHAFWRSSGDRLLSKDELAEIPVNKLQAIYRKYSRGNVYNYEEHIDLAKRLDIDGKLPASFMVVAPGSWTDEVWDDINRMRTLNTKQSQKRLQMHVCPLQIDIVKRIINRYSNKGELVGDPFAGLQTVPVCALEMGRDGWGCELSADYFRDGVGYLQSAESQIDVPTLFDFFGEDVSVCQYIVPES